MCIFVQEVDHNEKYYLHNKATDPSGLLFFKFLETIEAFLHIMFVSDIYIGCGEK